LKLADTPLQPLIKTQCDYILSQQLEDGAIPWFDGGHLDPWDHVESAMALTVGGEYQAAQRAYLWLRDMQRDDGSWGIRYEQGQITDHSRTETNFVAYVAVGVWHYYLATQNLGFVEIMWPTVYRALNLVLRAQHEEGDIAWAFDEAGQQLDDALITGCSSIYKSLECGVKLAELLGENSAAYLEAYHRLGDALRFKPERFDRNWAPKTRFSMDWFYPVLSGVFTGFCAEQRIASRWTDFVEDGIGCRCVSDEPWVTIAESSELVMALMAAGNEYKAKELLEWLLQWRDNDGIHWTGWQFADNAYWPLEKPTWTTAAFVLAIDSVYSLTPAHTLFKDHLIKREAAVPL